jgi:hypothetical protein
MPYCFLCKQWFGFLPDQPVNFSRGVASKLLLLIKDSVRVPCNYWPSTMNLHIEWIQTHHNVVVAAKNVDRPRYYKPHGNMLQYSTCAPIQTGYTNCGLLFFDIIAKFPKNYKHHQGLSPKTLNGNGLLRCQNMEPTCAKTLILSPFRFNGVFISFIYLKLTKHHDKRDVPKPTAHQGGPRCLKNQDQDSKWLCKSHTYTTWNNFKKKWDAAAPIY